MINPIQRSKTLLGGLALVALSAITADAAAAIATPVTLDFSTLTLGSIGGKSNLAPLANGNCAGTGFSGCYYEDGVAVGIVEDTGNLTAHLHRVTTGPNPPLLGYHSDSSGVYIRAVDGTAFSLSSMDFLAPISDANVIYGNNPSFVDGIILPPDPPLTTPGSNEYWEILGFNTAVNPSIGTGDGTNYTTRVAYQQVVNGFDGELTLNSDFQNINAFWIHYKGYPQTPTNGIAFSVDIDNVKLGPAVTAPVPIPAAAWLFGSGLLGLLSLARRKTRSGA